MYAAIRQGKAKAGMAEELARTIKEGAIPIISDVPGFQAYYVIYAPDDTVTAISIFDDYVGAEESNQRVLAWIEQSLAPLLTGPASAVAGPVIVHTLALHTGAVDGAWREWMASRVNPSARLGPTAGLIGYDHLHGRLRSRFRLGSTPRETALAQASAGAHHRARNTGAQVFVKGLPRR